jgi:hypothetical protein
MEIITINQTSPSPQGQYITCPHCSIMVEIIQLNCKIFRCGIYKSSGEQIDSHLPKNECDQLVQTNAIYGCGKPFCIKNNIPPFVVEKCDYI